MTADELRTTALYFRALAEVEAEPQCRADLILIADEYEAAAADPARFEISAGLRITLPA